MKDFGDTIPGHGGVTDRFDCQLIMAMFAYLYYWNYVAAPATTLGEVLEVSQHLGAVSVRSVGLGQPPNGVTLARWPVCWPQSRPSTGRHSALSSKAT